MVSGTRSAEQGMWDADKPDLSDRLQLPLLIPSPFFLKCAFPICHCVQCPRHGERGCHPALPASGSFQIQELKDGLFFRFGLIPQVFVEIPVAETFLSALELWDEGSCQQLPLESCCSRAAVSSGCS